MCYCTILVKSNHSLFIQRIRELRSTLENGKTTITSTEDVGEQTNHILTSLTEHDSGSSEVESGPSRTNKILQTLSSSSDVESGISSDYSLSGRPPSSPIVLQHQSSAETNDIPTIERIAFELNSIALDWCSYQAPFHCACAIPFDSAQRKVYKTKS